MDYTPARRCATLVCANDSDALRLEAWFRIRGSELLKVGAAVAVRGIGGRGKGANSSAAVGKEWNVGPVGARVRVRLPRDARISSLPNTRTILFHKSIEPWWCLAVVVAEAQRWCLCAKAD